MNDNKLPKHVAIIMDGNRRWAKNKNKTSLDGHKAGFKNLKKLCVHILNKGITHLSVYAFSTENFNRSKKEVDYLMDLAVNAFTSDFKEVDKYKIKVVFSGQRELLREDVQMSMKKLEDKTKDYEQGIFNICLSYGGRAEIVNATKLIVQDIKNGNLDIDDLSEEIYSKYFYQDLPDVDFMIRTSGEQRLSNFLLWQNAYAEFYFPDVHFPDFNELEFDKALEVYYNRNRRFGGDNIETKSN